MSTIFISYRREGGEFLGKILYDELSKNGYSVFFDVESLRSGKFNEQLYEKIEESDDFLLILTPDCLDRCKNQNDWVRKETEHAVKLHKNIIPIVTRGFEFPENLPEKMKELPMYERIEASADGMETAMKKLKRMIKSAPNTELSEIDEDFKFNAKISFLALILAHMMAIFLCFEVIKPLISSEEAFWFIISCFHIFCAVIGAVLMNRYKKYKLMYWVYDLYIILCGAFALWAR